MNKVPLHSLDPKYVFEFANRKFERIHHLRNKNYISSLDNKLCAFFSDVNYQTYCVIALDEMVMPLGISERWEFAAEKARMSEMLATAYKPPKG